MRFSQIDFELNYFRKALSVSNGKSVHLLFYFEPELVTFRLRDAMEFTNLVIDVRDRGIEKRSVVLSRYLQRCKEFFEFIISQANQLCKR